VDPSTGEVIDRHHPLSGACVTGTILAIPSARGSCTGSSVMLELIQIVWAESNAVVFANSVLGARTQKYPDYLDICIALTGRAPFVGCHRDEGRVATLRIDLESPEEFDDAFYPLLGYQVGLFCALRFPSFAVSSGCGRISMP
jgi:predicted aconitase